MSIFRKLYEEDKRTHYFSWEYQRFVRYVPKFWTACIAFVFCGYAAFYFAGLIASMFDQTGEISSYFKSPYSIAMLVISLIVFVTLISPNRIQKATLNIKIGKVYKNKSCYNEYIEASDKVIQNILQVVHFDRPPENCYHSYLICQTMLPRIVSAMSFGQIQPKEVKSLFGKHNRSATSKDIEKLKAFNTHISNIGRIYHHVMQQDDEHKNKLKSNKIRQDVKTIKDNTDIDLLLKTYFEGIPVDDILA